MHHPVLATVITQSQMHVQIKHSLAHLQDLITTLADKVVINLVDVLDNALFVHVFGFEL